MKPLKLFVQWHYGTTYRIHRGYETPVLGPIEPQLLSTEHDARSFIRKLRLEHADYLNLLHEVDGLTPNSDISLDYAQRDLARVAWGRHRRIRFYKLDSFAYDFNNTDNNHYPAIRHMQGTIDQGAAYHFVPATLLLLSDPNPADVRFFRLAEGPQAQAFLDTLTLSDEQLAMMIDELKLRAWPNRADRLKSLLMALTRGQIVAVLIYDDIIIPPKRKGPEDLPVEEYTPKSYTLGPHEEPGYEPSPHSGLHNQAELTPDFETSVESFKPIRQVDMDNLSPEDKATRKALADQGWNEDKVEEVLESGNQFSLEKMEKDTTLYGFVTAGRDNSKLENKAYWLDKNGFSDVEDKFFKQGHWDREGIKDYLALPCFNRANDVITVELTESQTVVTSTIGKATELLKYTGENGYTTGTLGKIMGGGGTQISPDARKLQLISGK